MSGEADKGLSHPCDIGTGASTLHFTCSEPRTPPERGCQSYLTAIQQVCHTQADNAKPRCRYGLVIEYRTSTPKHAVRSSKSKSALGPQPMDVIRTAPERNDYAAGASSVSPGLAGFVHSTLVTQDPPALRHNYAWEQKPKLQRPLPLILRHHRLPSRF